MIIKACSEFISSDSFAEWTYAVLYKRCICLVVGRMRDEYFNLPSGGRFVLESSAYVSESLKTVKVPLPAWM